MDQLRQLSNPFQVVSVIPTSELLVMETDDHLKYQGLHGVDSEMAKEINTEATLLPSEEFGVTTWTSLKPWSPHQYHSSGGANFSSPHLNVSVFYFPVQTQPALLIYVLDSSNVPVFCCTHKGL